MARASSGQARDGGSSDASTRPGHIRLSSTELMKKYRGEDALRRPIR